MNEELDNLFKPYNSTGIVIPMEKAFELAKFKQIIQSASREQAIQIAIECFQLMLTREHLVKEMIKQDLGFNKAA